MGGILEEGFHQQGPGSELAFVGDKKSLLLSKSSRQLLGRGFQRWNISPSQSSHGQSLLYLVKSVCFSIIPKSISAVSRKICLLTSKVLLLHQAHDKIMAGRILNELKLPSQCFPSISYGKKRAGENDGLDRLTSYSLVKVGLGSAHVKQCCCFSGQICHFVRNGPRNNRLQEPFSSMKSPSCDY